MSGTDIDDMTREKFKFWKVPSLKQFLKKRSLSCVGTKDMLVARAFAAWELKIPEDKTVAQKDKILSEDYR